MYNTEVLLIIGKVFVQMYGFLWKNNDICNIILFGKRWIVEECRSSPELF